ncbi:MAG: AAA family ATPase [Pseudomonadota bacterium]
MLNSIWVWVSNYQGLLEIINMTIGLFGTGIGVLQYRAKRQQIRKVHELEAELKTARQERDEAETRLSPVAEENGVLRLRNDELAEVNAGLSNRAEHAEERLQAVLDLTRDSTSEMWLREPIEPPEGLHERMHSSIPILCLANLKGGVGKTTLAANLAAYFDREHGERVLLIDLDYQGSLSSMATEAGQAGYLSRDFEKPGAISCLVGVLPRTVRVDGTQRAELVDSAQRLSSFEDRRLLAWLSRQVEEDVRFSLATLLQSDTVQGRFDRVIIDTAPRLSAGTINGLTAATHVIVPTILDKTSVESVGFFLGALERLRPKLLPNLRERDVAVVATKRAYMPATPLRAEEERARHSLIQEMEERGVVEQQLFSPMIPNITAFRRTFTGIAYTQEAEVRSLVKELGDKVAQFAVARRSQRGSLRNAS